MPYRELDKYFFELQKESIPKTDRMYLESVIRLYSLASQRYQMILPMTRKRLFFEMFQVNLEAFEKYGQYLKDLKSKSNLPDDVCRAIKDTISYMIDPNGPISQVP